MPQMAPLNWLILFIFFTLIFMLFNFMNFYMFMYNPFFKKLKTLKNKINWKW